VQWNNIVWYVKAGEHMNIQRKDPDKLLAAITSDERAAHQGHLKIFFGYAAGVGKTYAMLQAAHAAKERGIDVVAGYVEPHTRSETTALLNGLEQLPRLSVEYNGILLNEFDLDAAIARKPQLILVDELAHTNAKGLRHLKRYQDVQELLKAGINVYSTVNVQHIESLNDVVESITGVMVRERIPDSVFDGADQVELIDIEPQDLIERLNTGKVYKGEQAERATQNFFTPGNLTALREIALRRCADRVNLLTENVRVKTNLGFCTDEHILVCLSSAPSNAKIIRTAARMAAAFKGAFTALFVETPDFTVMSEENKKRLRSNTRLAQQLGAQIETVYGDDIPFQIAEFARLSGVTKIVIGRSTAKRRGIFGKPTLTEKLIENAPNVDVHIIPDSTESTTYHSKKAPGMNFVISLCDIGKSMAILLLATLTGVAFSKLGFTDANIIAVYILGVLLISVITTNRIYSLVASVVSVLVFNFFFTVPRLTFQTYGSGYPVTFIVMFLSAFIMGSLAARLKEHAKQSAQAAYRTKVLLDTNQLLQRAYGKEEILAATANQLVKLLGRDIVAYLSEADGLGEPMVFFSADGAPNESCISENEKAVAAWALKNNKHAGATTDTLSSAKCLYLAIRVNSHVYGVVGIVIDNRPLDVFESSVLLSILGECALALENEKNAREKEKTAVLAKNEQLRANLLRAISHDLRTPLTSISGNASNLMSNGASFDEDTKKQIYSDIYDDSMWLINLVENLLSVTRIEEGRMNLNLTTELMDEVIAEALLHVNRKRVEHNIKVQSAEDYILAQIDPKLIVQVIINMVDNAIKYTPEGSDISIFTEKKQGKVIVRIVDNGPGIPDEVKLHIFDMFYTGKNQIADSRRSLGLGLSLCKSIIQAHGGEISVADSMPHGTAFTFTLPAGEVSLHE
jgi:two-component system sensor histidine kinase KdpD